MTTVQDVVSQANKVFTEGLNGGDIKQAISVYTENAVLAPAPALTNQAPYLVSGIAAVEEFWAGLLASGLNSVELHPEQIEERGGQLWDIGRFALKLGDTPVNGFYVVVAQKVGDDYKWVVDAFGPDAA